MTHRLQTIFATPTGEADYEQQMRMHLEAGDFASAASQLSADLADMDRDLARLCLGMGNDQVELSGWEDLFDAISMMEGEAVTGVAVGLMNDPDATFDKDGLHHPEVTLGIYCDGKFTWSEANREVLMQQAAEETPLWAGSEEDVEVYLELEGLERLNTALLRHKNRHFFRDGAPEQAPIGYVEFVLAGWWRALLFHQAVAEQFAEHGLPGNPLVLSGLVEMRPEVAIVHQAMKQVDVAIPETGSLVQLHVEIKEEVEEEESAAARLKRQLADSAANEQEPEKRGFFQRLFARN